MKLGDIKRGKDLGFNANNGRKYIWHTCEGCGKERWVKLAKGRPVNMTCCSCANKDNQGWGEQNSNWKGGGYKDVRGYIVVTLSPGDFFLPMAQRQRYVREHRLMMAKHLGRCLSPQEIVHHENGIKDDNRLENLRLFTNGGEHTKYHAIFKQSLT